MIFNSGTPYNVTVNQDLSEDLQFNDRPEFNTNPSGPCTFPTKAACQFMIPTGQYTQIPINYLTGPPTLLSICGWRKPSASDRKLAARAGLSRVVVPAAVGAVVVRAAVVAEAVVLDVARAVVSGVARQPLAATT